jgi:hypothetical protein
VLEDTKLYFTAPLRWDGEDWVAFGGILAAIGAAHQFDEKVREHFATGSKAVLNGGDDEYRWIRRIIGYGVAGATACE